MEMGKVLRRRLQSKPDDQIQETEDHVHSYQSIRWSRYNVLWLRPGVMSQVNLNEDYWNHMGINSPKSNKRNVAAEGGIVAVYYIGTLIGALIAGSLADRAGRIKAVVFGSMWALIGAVLQASAQNIAWMCCARVIAGVGVGAIDCVVPVWSAEVSSHSARGAFLAIEFFMVRIGTLTLASISLC